MQNSFLIKAVLFAFSILVMWGCQDELCDDITANPLRIGFYTTENGQTVPEYVDSLSVVGLGKDEYLYDNRFQVGMIEIPLNITTDSCGFKFVFPDGVDTLKVFYERNLSLVSVECGFVTFFDIQSLQVTNNSIQSYNIEEHNVTNENEEHIHLFLHPASD